MEPMLPMPMFLEPVEPMPTIEPDPMVPVVIVLPLPMKPEPLFTLPMEEVPMEVAVPMVPRVVFLELEVPIIWADAAKGRASARTKARHTTTLLLLDIRAFSCFLRTGAYPTPSSPG